MLVRGEAGVPILSGTRTTHHMSRIEREIDGARKAARGLEGADRAAAESRVADPFAERWALGSDIVATLAQKDSLGSP